MKRVIRQFVAFVVAVIATGAAASIVQTQLHLAPLIALGAPVTAIMRLMVTLEDLARFGPVMSAICAAALLPALIVGRWVSRSGPVKWRMPILAMAGGVGLWAGFRVMALVTPIPALVVATRDAGGLAAMCMTGILGGAIYAHMTRCGRQAEVTRTDRLRALVGATLLAVPVVFFLAMAPRQAKEVDHVDVASYDVQTIASGLDRPWSLAFLPDGRKLVSEEAGRLLIIEADGTSSPVALDGLSFDLREGGVNRLMDVALDPAFSRNRLIYLSMGYGEPGANGTRVARARLVQDKIEDVRILFSSTLKSAASNNGGRLAFLPDDTLVLTVGDGDSRLEAQNLSSHLGKVVRIDRAGRPPASNPFLTHAGAAPEVYSLGHRNPQGMTIDPTSGALLLTEHGARGGDEINVVEAGSNYGWPLATAGIDYSFARVTPFRQLNGYAPPSLSWTPSIAPAGLAVYDGPLFPAWRGDLLVAALKERSLRRVIRKDGQIVGQQRLLAELGKRIRDVNVAPDGAIYVLTDGVDAALLRIIPAKAGA